MALTPVRGVSLLAHAVRGLAESGCVRHIVVTVTPDDVEGTRSALGDPALPARVLVINSRTDIDCDDIGGDDIAAVRAGLLAALDDVPDAATVLVHDPLRAFAPPELIRSVVAAVGLGAGAVVPVLPLTDTVKRVDQYGRVVGTPDRAALRVVQTPLGFPVDVLRAACDPTGETEGPPGLLRRVARRLGVPVTTVPGDVRARRVRTPFDVLVFDETAFDTGGEKIA